MYHRDLLPACASSCGTKWVDLIWKSAERVHNLSPFYGPSQRSPCQTGLLCRRRPTRPPRPARRRVTRATVTAAAGPTAGWQVPWRVTVARVPRRPPPATWQPSPASPPLASRSPPSPVTKRAHIQHVSAISPHTAANRPVDVVSQEAFWSR